MSTIDQDQTNLENKKPFNPPRSQPIPIPPRNSMRNGCGIPCNITRFDGVFSRREPEERSQPGHKNVLLCLDPRKKNSNPNTSFQVSSRLENDSNTDDFLDFPNPPQELLDRFAKYPLLKKKPLSSKNCPKAKQSFTSKNCAKAKQLFSNNNYSKA